MADVCALIGCTLKDKDQTTGDALKATASEPVSLIVGLIFGVFAVYLSWTSNTEIGYSLPYKVFYGFFSFFFGFTYIVYYAFMKWDLLQVIGNVKHINNSVYETAIHTGFNVMKHTA